MIIEDWKDIQGFEGYYRVNIKGEVESYDRYVNVKNGFKRLMKGRKMKPFKGKDGYLYYLLTVDNVSKHIALHRLIAIHFIANSECKREVNHIDANRLNNCISNLEWVTPKENIQHSIRLGNNIICVPGENNPAAKLTKEQVLQIRTAEGSQPQIAKRFNISRSAVGLIKRKQTWAHV